MLHPCWKGVGHAFNFDQSQVKSHEGLTCIRVCGFCKLVFSTRLIEYSLVRACFWQGPLFLFLQARVFISPCVFLTWSIVSSASLSIHQSVRVFDKLHCTPRGLFLKAPGNYWARQAVLFSIPDGSFKSFENYTVKLSAKETNRLHQRSEHTLLFLRLCFKNTISGPLSFWYFRETRGRIVFSAECMIFW